MVCIGVFQPFYVARSLHNYILKISQCQADPQLNKKHSFSGAKVCISYLLFLLFFLSDSDCCHCQLNGFTKFSLEL